MAASFVNWTRRRMLFFAFAAAFVFTPIAHLAAQAPDLAEQVVIRRTAYGVPHIRAENLRAAGFGMAYVQLQDYGFRVVRGLVSAKGERSRYEGRDHMAGDFVNRHTYRRAVETYGRLHADTRAVLEGFAAGVNYYIQLHPDEFPDWVQPNFSGYVVAARDIPGPSLWSIRRFVEGLKEKRNGVDKASLAVPTPWTRAARRAEPPHPDAGSNAWALAPSRTESGHAILLRNPHLSWNAGYYEAHVNVPGVLNFYGDFRIGGPFGIVGGFNDHLGWATTNNNPDVDEIYALKVDPERPDHYLFNGASLPLTREDLTVTFKNGEGLAHETRTFYHTPLGPVIYRGNGKIYVYRSASVGRYRIGEQFLRMMQAANLEEWKEAMRIRARAASNFTYADDAGNIFYVWNASVPQLPHPSGGDTLAIPADETDDIWRRLIPWDRLPHLQNPEGGYLHNENDSFHFTNLNEMLAREEYPLYFPEPRFRLRSQLSVNLLAGEKTYSLEEIVQLKNNLRMLLADRVKGDLLAAVRASDPSKEIAAAADLLADWNNTVAPESKGSVLFAEWWDRYVETGTAADGTPASVGFDATAESLFEKPWSPEAPMETPRGLADPLRAAEAFEWAVRETEERWGDWDVAWGEVHRVRRGEVDVPVGGCSGSLGCFRVLWYDEAADGKFVASGGDGWVFAVSFSDPPRAYSILAYGQSPQPSSPYHDNQAAMFARGEMKEVAFTEEQIRENLVIRYHPGEESDL